MYSRYYNQRSYSELKDFIDFSVKNSFKTKRFNKFDPFDGIRSVKVLEFIDDYEIEIKSDKNRLLNFKRYLMPGHARNWYKLYVTLNRNPPQTWKELKELFLLDFLPRDSNRILSQRMYDFKQKAGEPVSNYIIEKHLMCLDIKPKMSDKQIIDVIIEDLIPQIKSLIMIEKIRNLQHLQDRAVMIELSLREREKVKVRENQSERNLSEISATLFKDPKFYSKETEPNDLIRPDRHRMLDVYEMYGSSDSEISDFDVFEELPERNSDSESFESMSDSKLIDCENPKVISEENSSVKELEYQLEIVSNSSDESKVNYEFKETENWKESSENFDIKSNEINKTDIQNCENTEKISSCTIIVQQINLIQKSKTYEIEINDRKEVLNETACINAENHCEIISHKDKISIIKECEGFGDIFVKERDLSFDLNLESKGTFQICIETLNNKNQIKTELPPIYSKQTLITQKGIERINEEISELLSSVLHLILLIIFISIRLIIMIMSYLMSIKNLDDSQDFQLGKQIEDKRSYVSGNQLMNVKTSKDEIKIVMNSEKCSNYNSGELNLNNDERYKIKNRNRVAKTKGIRKIIYCIITAIIISSYFLNYNKMKANYKLNPNGKVTQNNLTLKYVSNYVLKSGNISKINQSIRLSNKKEKRINYKHFRKKCFPKN